MHAIDTSTAVNGKFVNKNIPAGVAGTVADAAWLNSVQEEIINLIVAAGIEPSAANNAQMTAAVKTIAGQKNYRTVISGDSIAPVVGVSDTYSFSQGFTVHTGDVLDVTFEMRYNLSSSKTITVKLQTADSSLNVALLAETAFAASGFFAQRFVYKIPAGIDAASALITLVIPNYDSSEMSFAINGVSAGA